MKTDNEIGNRLKRFREIAGMSQSALAERCGWASQSRVGNYESGSRKVSADDAIILSKALGVSPSVLLFGEHGNVSYAGLNEPKGNYPVISWVSAGAWSEAIEPYHRKSIDRWYETTVDCSESSFWLDVKGDSMTSPVGLSIPEGMVILVDPEVEPINGKLVVAKLESENEATFKKYVIDAGNKYLKPLNPQYSMIPINGNCRIIGVVVDAKIANLP
ncbi:LexA family transcriptional regulator [Candidatus Symbiopectobacterium sp. NZEC127]|uniref:LexA family protein n=1 Tax=Candidatus Symbiopectobacterium sp. NZEC127 TaxID=2820472 RepID=UPI002227F5FE|nr:LexA family transcriptional regulator [Candidatus Symbiopectobacterium sp. NZEC127]MCW2485748.1 LexA family transcriptional regulator [Candidatus Symbiopectobacterium sp. NZEC127]